MATDTQKEYYPFLNGSDIAEFPEGVECDIEKIRDRKDGKGFFIDVKADNGQNYTITANEVLTSMLIKKLEGSHIRVFPYKKVTKDGPRFYLSLREQDGSEPAKATTKTNSYKRGK